MVLSVHSDDTKHHIAVLYIFLIRCVYLLDDSFIRSDYLHVASDSDSIRIAVNKTVARSVLDKVDSIFSCSSGYIFTDVQDHGLYIF